MKRRDPLTRYEVTEAGCWRWLGATTASRGGYGLIFKSKKTIKAHRVFYEHHVGPIPEGLQLDHLCRNTSCVNPDHLEAVTQRENILRGTAPSAVHARKTHCKNGHAFTPENTRITVKGGRGCRACQRDYARTRSEAIRAAALEAGELGRDGFGLSRGEKELRAIALRGEGVPYEAIAIRLGVSYGTAHRWVNATEARADEREARSRIYGRSW